MQIVYWWHLFWTANNQEEIAYVCDEDDDETFEQYLVKFYQWDEDQYTDKYNKIIWLVEAGYPKPKSSIWGYDLTGPRYQLKIQNEGKNGLDIEQFFIMFVGSRYNAILL